LISITFRLLVVLGRALSEARSDGRFGRRIPGLGGGLRSRSQSWGVVAVGGVGFLDLLDDRARSCLRRRVVVLVVP